MVKTVLNINGAILSSETDPFALLSVVTCSRAHCEYIFHSVKLLPGKLFYVKPESRN